MLQLGIFYNISSFTDSIIPWGVAISGVLIVGGGEMPSSDAQRAVLVSELALIAPPSGY